MRLLDMPDGRGARDRSCKAPGVKGGRTRSLRKLKGVNGVMGVLGVEMYRPWHFGHISSVEGVGAGRLLTTFPARRG